MVIEYKSPLENGEADYAEHSHGSKAKKVQAGYLTPKVDPAAENQSLAPVAVTATTILERHTTYRVISSAAWHFRLSADGAVAAATTDVYVPADEPVFINMNGFDTLNTTGGGAVFQALEVR